MARGGPLLHMGTTVTEPAKEWGCTSLLPLAEGRVDEFCAPGQDDETKQTVSPRRAVARWFLFNTARVCPNK